MKNHTRRWAIVGAIVVIVGLGLVFAYQAAKASSALNRAANEGEILQGQIAAGDVGGAKNTLASLRQSTAQARSNTGGVLWDAGSAVPYFGNNLEAVQTVSRVLDDIVQQGLPPVVEVADSVNVETFSPKDGRIDIESMKKLGPSVATADKVLSAGNREIRGIDPESLLGSLQLPVEKLKGKIQSAQSAAHTADIAIKLLPTMLGDDDSRSYLLIVQNNAEIRSTGGMPGSFAIIKAKGGKISMGAQGSSRDLQPFDKPVLKLTDDENSLYTQLLGSDFRDINFTPDFPRTGELARTMVKKVAGNNVDGVISVDPVALSYILEGTGPVLLPQGTRLNSENAVDLLLNQVYSDYPDPFEQDEFFAASARKIFDAVASGQGEQRNVIAGMVKAAQENRILVWSSHEDEQKILAQTRLSGALPGDTGTIPQVGLYLNDSTGAKMQYYLEYDTKVKATKCTDDGVQTLTTSTVLQSNAAADASYLPKSIVGSGFGGPLGTMRMNLRFYAPAGGKFTGATVNGKRTTIYEESHQGRKVTIVSLLVKPGQKFAVGTTMVSGKGQDKDAVFSTTPGIQPTKNNVRVPSACVD